MIKLEKLQQPDILHSNKEKWTKEYINAKKSKAANLEELKNKYRHSEIKEQVIRETKGKCAYCESYIRHTYPGDIEHIKPKSQFDTHIFEWENLTLACGECNRRKNDNYDENLEIINPYKVDPANYLIAYGPLIFPRPGDDSGKLTYELLELNRAELFERRKDRLQLLQLLLDDYASEKNELLKKLYKRKIDKELDISNEYVMVTKAFIETAMKQLRKSRK